MAAKTCIGLDLGSSSVKVAQVLRGRGSELKLLAFGIEPIPPDAIVDGAIMNQSAVVDAVQALMGRLQLKQKEVALAISGHSVIIKKISLPAMSADELAESIQWEAEQYIPFDINDVNLDYVPLTTPGTGDNIDVILVAVKKEKINDYTSVISQTGKVPVLVDVDAFALQNCYEMNHDVSENRVLALVNIGASVPKRIFPGPRMSRPASIASRGTKHVST